MNPKELLKSVLPINTRHWLRRQPRRALHAISWDFDLFRRTTPIDRHWGGKRGQIIDRFYIERFLEQNSEHVRGHVLEFGDDAYTLRFGGTRVTQSDVMHLSAENPKATIIGDLSDCRHIATGTFDCIICTQVLLLVFDLRAAVRELHRILKPGGVLLLTAPGIQKISRGDMEAGGEYWRFTSLSMRRLFEEAFPGESLDVSVGGNVLAATAFLHGLAVEDVGRGKLNRVDPDFPVSIGIRAVKPLAESKTERQP